jgi:hypothetical protein
VQEGKEQRETKTQWNRQANTSSETQSVLRAFPASWFLDLLGEKLNFVRFEFLTALFCGTLWCVSWWIGTDVCSISVFPCTVWPLRWRQYDPFKM